MLPFAFYIVKLIVCSLFLYGYYVFFLRNRVYHNYNRFYLLVVIILSITLPLVKISLFYYEANNHTSVVKMLQVVNMGDQYLDEVIIRNDDKNISIETAIWWLIAFVYLVLILRFIKSIYAIYVLKNKNPHYYFEGINIISTNDKRTPFSFFNDIFWNEAIDINTDNGQRIFRHEIAHVQQKHSYDKLFMIISLIAFWFNPVFWIIRKELGMIHEFIADKKAIADGNTHDFASMILQTVYPEKQLDLTNNFFYSPIKRRLTMITKNKSRASYISRLLVLPLAIILFAAFTFKINNTSVSARLNKPITVVIDAGHGGTDNGAFDKENVNEKDLTLAFAKAIKKYNTDENIKIILTRDADVFQTPQERAINANKVVPDLFLSIHFNATVDADKEMNTGMSVLIAKDGYANTEKSKLFASAIIQSFTNNYHLAVPQNPMQQNAKIWVLQEVKCPSVLIEGGYMSNKKDMDYLKSENGKEVFAKNVLRAIQNYEATMNQNSGVLHPANAVAQSATIPPVHLQESINSINTGNTKTDTMPDKVFTKVQQEPGFPGGMDAWRLYLQKNLNAGTPVDEGWKPGKYTIMVQFMVDKDGNVKDVKTTNYQNSKTAHQCIELIKHGPKWLPAVQNGKYVNAYKKQPITFIVSEG